MLQSKYLIMQLGHRALTLHAILCILMYIVLSCQASTRYNFVVRETPYRRLCNTKRILTVNGRFPGPTLYVHKGDTIYVKVLNMGRHNITIHWHGVKQPRNPWSDGPEYITQCPIQPGRQFVQKVIFSEEEGTIWWHAHSDWGRATVHGAIVVYPKFGCSYPFPRPNKEKIIILGEWWKQDVRKIVDSFIQSGGEPMASDALTINGHPGDLYPCSRLGTFKLKVNRGRTYLLRIVNAAINTLLFYSVAEHQLTVVGTDGSYVKPLQTDYVAISPGQTIDVLLHANQKPGRYYMAARAYSSNPKVQFDNTTTTAIIQYSTGYRSSTPIFPRLPPYNDTKTAFGFFGSLRSLASKEHPVKVPCPVDTKLITTVSINTLPCPANHPCDGPNENRFAASMNNISFANPPVAILEAYYNMHMKGVFGSKFPRFPPYEYNYTGENLPEALEKTKKGTEVIFLDYGSTVEMVFQNTALLGAIDHPMHLHGYNFYIIGYGFGNFNKERDPLRYNLIDPPYENVVTVPKNGWAAIRFKATNPGVWFVHCHIDRHQTWGMNTVLIVKNGEQSNEKILPPPPDMPPC